MIIQPRRSHHSLMMVVPDFHLVMMEMVVEEAVAVGATGQVDSSFLDFFFS